MSLSLPKPLGLVLEECEEGSPSGVFVKDVSENGSAASYSSKIAGSKLLQVGGVDVTAQSFDNIMELIINTEQKVDLVFDVEDDEAMAADYELGAPVAIIVQQPGRDDLIINAAVGDNLRKVLLDSGFEVYQGLKEKLGNCGGGGQCTFCAVNFVESDGWAQRSDYEDSKLRKFPAARLACLNNIQGPATIEKLKR